MMVMIPAAPAAALVATLDLLHALALYGLLCVVLVDAGWRLDGWHGRARWRLNYSTLFGKGANAR
ncbi:MAG TPA: hypothetical protein VGC99_14435 [Candidatus Tectomicrobia bacterium]